MITSSRTSQTYATKSTFKEIDEFIKLKRTEGYYIVDFDFGAGLYAVIMDKGNEFLEQFHWWSKEFDKNKVSEFWEKGYRLTHLFHDNSDWIYVFSKLENQKPQSYSIDDEFPKTQIQKRWDEGYSISKIAYGQNQWVVFFLKDIGYNPGWALRRNIDAEEIKNWLDEDKIITDLVWGNNQWAIANGRHKLYKHQVIESSTTFPYECIKKRWQDGYDITLCAFGESMWHVLFSSNNKEQVLLNEKNRANKELVEILAECKNLFDEKKYTKIIELFESNPLTKEHEECVSYYLWSLWGADGYEAKAYDLSFEYGAKFNTKRWDRIKGHYSKWKKSYDKALEFYKHSSEEQYLEVLSIFEGFRKLYHEKQYAEVINYFETKLFNSISENYLDIAEKYVWALYRNNGTEVKAYEQYKKFSQQHPDNEIFKLAGAYITQWVGIRNSDIDSLEESTSIFKSLNKKDEVDKNKERIIKIKSDIKNKEKKEKEVEKAIKKEKERKNKDEEKQKKIEEELRNHKLKSSRGEIYCMFCGVDKKQLYNYESCNGRVNGHNYIFMKDNKDNWKLKCNKCGKSRSYSRESCS
jgi:hypothetical protein